MSKQPPPAPTASAVGPCPTVIQIVGRPGTGSLPSTIAPPDHPCQKSFDAEVSGTGSKTLPTSKTANKVEMLKGLINKHNKKTISSLLQSIIETGDRAELALFRTLRLGPNFQLVLAQAVSELDLEAKHRGDIFVDHLGWSGGAKVLGKLPVLGRPTILITVGQGPTALAVGAGGGCLDIFTLIYPFSSLSPSLWETARYRLKYCLKGPLNPKQPTNHRRSFVQNCTFKDNTFNVTKE